MSPSVPPLYLSCTNLANIGLPSYSSVVSRPPPFPIQCAANHKKLTELNIRKIVFCQDSDGQCTFEGDPEFEYEAINYLPNS